VPGGPGTPSLPTVPVPVVVAVFVVVYVGMFIGELPRLQVDRTGIALLGAIALLVTGSVSVEGAVRHLDVPTLALLFGMMVLSAQMRLGGVYSAVAGRVARASVDPSALLALVVALVGVLAAVFTNDIVTLAVTPPVLRLSRARGLDPIPYLLAVACAANVGSAATLIGNPQNILVGQALHMDFAGYLGRAGPPAALGLAAVWAVVALAYRGRWTAAGADGSTDEAPEEERPFLPRQATKAVALASGAFVAFLFAPWPRELVALAAAGIVLSGRRFHSREILKMIDWQLLVLFVGLFVVNGTLGDSGLADRALTTLGARGVDVTHPAWLFGSSVVLSNLVSNVPAVMLLLPMATAPHDGTTLALASTLAGNLLVVGSIANIIVVEQARRYGVAIDWRTHARVGVPVTLLTLALAALALAVA
jgi:Na+/H+ antiporter NhaD/arsenite permease-like protein